MLASSSGASISSSRQNGLGLYLNRPNISAMAVSAFSPPESSWTLCSRLPGGWAMISMPLSSGSFSSSSVRPARPPPNSVLKVSWKLRLIAANASVNRCRVVSSIRLMASARLRDRVDQILALGGQERVAGFELVELLDGHHVHRAEPIDLGAQPRRSPLRRSASAAAASVDGAGVGGSTAATCDRDRRLSTSSSSSARRRRSTRASGVDVARRVRAAATSATHFVERRLDGVDAGLREVRQSLSAVARATSSSETTARTDVERAARASLIAASCASASDAQRRHRVVGATARSARSASSARTSASSCASPVDDRRAQLVDAPARVVELGGRARRRALRARPALLRAAALRRRAPTRARRARRARRRPRPRGGSAPRPLRAPRTGAAARPSAARRPRAARRRAARSTRAPRPAGARARRAPLRPAAARGRAARASAPAASSSSAARCSCAS